MSPADELVIMLIRFVSALRIFSGGEMFQLLSRDHQAQKSKSLYLKKITLESHRTASLSSLIELF